MKNIILILSIFLVSCNNSNTVTLSQEEYNQLKGNSVKSEYPITLEPITWTTDFTMITIKNHEYLFAETRCGYGGIAFTHNPECKFCKKDTLQWK